VCSISESIVRFLLELVVVCVYLCPLTFIYLQEYPGPNSIQLQLSNSSTGLGLWKPTATELEVLLNYRSKVMQRFCCMLYKVQREPGKEFKDPIISGTKE